MPQHVLGSSPGYGSGASHTTGRTMDTKAELQKIHRLEAELEQVVQKQKALRKEGGKDTGNEVRGQFN